MIRRGTKVKFRSRRGMVDGIVIAMRIKKNRRARRVGLTNLDTMMAKVADFERECIWDVSCGQLEENGQADSDTLQRAVELQNRITNHNEGIRHERARQNTENALANNLYSLPIGSDIEVQFRGGIWLTRTFLGFTGSRKVRFEECGKTRFAHPQHVRIPNGN